MAAKGGRSQFSMQVDRSHAEVCVGGEDSGEGRVTRLLRLFGIFGRIFSSFLCWPSKRNGGELDKYKKK